MDSLKQLQTTALKDGLSVTNYEKEIDAILNKRVVQARVNSIKEIHAQLKLRQYQDQEELS